MTASKIFVTGINHKTASLELLEVLSRHVGASGAATFDKIIQESGGLAQEMGLLSTCNRLEIYGVSANGAGHRLKDYLSGLVTTHVPLRSSHRRKPVSSEGKPAEVLDSGFRRNDGEGEPEQLPGLAQGPIEGAIYLKENADALNHLFSVAAGLESMVLGEADILAQVKAAYEGARLAGRTSAVLNTTFQRALYVGKLVRTETGICQGRVSVASVAVELAGKIFEDLTKLHIAVVGAGAMGLETAKRLLQARPQSQTFLSRSKERAEALAAEFGGQAGTLQDLPAVLRRSDVAIFQTSAPGAIVTRRLAETCLAGRSRSCFLIDIAMPRNVEEAVSEVPGVFLYNLEDLKAITQANYERRRQEVEKARRIVDQEVRKFFPQCQNRMTSSGSAQEPPALP